MPCSDQLVDEAVVEVESRRVGRPGRSGWIRGQRDREPVAADAEPLHQRDVLDVAVVVVARDLAAVPSVIRPGSAVNVSQMLGPLPSSSQPPSIWYDAVLVPNRKPGREQGEVVRGGRHHIREDIGMAVTAVRRFGEVVRDPRRGA